YRKPPWPPHTGAAESPPSPAAPGCHHSETRPAPRTPLATPGSPRLPLPAPPSGARRSAPRSTSQWPATPSAPPAAAPLPALCEHRARPTRPPRGGGAGAPETSPRRPDTPPRSTHPGTPAARTPVAVIPAPVIPARPWRQPAQRRTLADWWMRVQSSEAGQEREAWWRDTGDPSGQTPAVSI